jgi:hypothetical protein
MIDCTLSDLIERCHERGYTLAEVAECIVRRDGRHITVDDTHPAYPSKPKAGTGGPGTELKRLLKTWLGIKATPDCPCNAHAAQMDEWGPDGCEKPERLAVIVGWLEEQARARNLPFVRVAAEQMVKLAIRRARKTAQ